MMEDAVDAVRKGLKQGDVITSINGKPLKYYDQLKGIVKDLKNTKIIK